MDSFCIYCGEQLPSDPDKAAPRATCPACLERMGRGQRLCPFCRETIALKASQCPFCKEVLDPEEREKLYRRVNPLAVVSLIFGLLGCLYCIPGVLGIVMGAVATRQIERSGGLQTGEGLARGGIIAGVCWIVLYVVLIVIVSMSH